MEQQQMQNKEQKDKNDKKNQKKMTQEEKLAQIELKQSEKVRLDAVFEQLCKYGKKRK